MSIQLRVLGTASAMPLPNRNPSAQVLNIQGRLFLIDCAEGTVKQLARYRISLLKIEALMLSHIHGDHVFGIFALLSTMDMLGRTAPFHIYAPKAFAGILNFNKSYFLPRAAYDIVFHELQPKQPEIIFSAKKFEVLAFPLNHKIDCYGFIFREKEQAPNIIKEKIYEYSLTLAQIAAIKNHEDLCIDGEIIPNSELCYQKFSPRSYAYASDTAPFAELEDFLKSVNVLYHETTFLEAQKDLAIARYHSTTVDAATLAKKLQLDKLLIGHYSARCMDKEVYAEECRKIFPNTIALDDGDELEI